MTRALRRPRRRTTEDGAAAVEFALVVPLFVMLVFGVIAFAIVFAQQLSLGNAARQTARYGVVAHRTCTDIVQEVRDSATSIAMKSTDVTVKVGVGTSRATALATPTCTGDSAVVPCQGAASGSNVYVELGYRSELIIPLVVAEPTFDLTGQGVFKCELT